MAIRRAYSLLLPITLLVLAQPACVSGLVRKTPKMAKGCAKVGGTKAVVKSTKVAKAANVTKTVRVLAGSDVAEQLFKHTDDASRVGIYVVDDGAGSLNVWMRGGDRLTKTPAGLRSYIDDLDEMAMASSDAGVDVFVHPNLLPKLGQIDLGTNTHLADQHRYDAAPRSPHCGGVVGCGARRRPIQGCPCLVPGGRQHR